MNVIKTEQLDVYALFENGDLIVSVTLDGGVILTAEYPIKNLAKEFVQALQDEEGFIHSDDEVNAWNTIEAFDEAANLINEAIRYE